MSIMFFYMSALHFLHECTRFWRKTDYILPPLSLPDYILGQNGLIAFGDKMDYILPPFPPDNILEQNGLITFGVK